MLEKHLNDLLNTWKGRMKEDGFSAEYRDAVRDCLYELDNVLTEENSKIPNDPTEIKFWFY